jgi:hypothetical protein
VGSLDDAVEHYRCVLGFDVVERAADPGAYAIVRLDNSELHLRPGPPERREPDRWNAILFVGDVRRAARVMRDNGAEIVVGIGPTPLSRETLEVRDPWGNVLAVALDERRLKAVIGQAERAVLPARARVAVRDRRHAREEHEHQFAFSEFCRGLPGSDPYFMYFTGGLLHWVRAAAALVPPSVNLVLIGSNLPEDECEWIRERLPRPFHPIGLGIDDNTTWEWLFAANTGNFGWLDVDCFVLAPHLFDEMAAIEDDVAVNAIWTYDSGAGFPIACTHFAFLNAAAIRAVQRAAGGIGPANYDWTGSNWYYLHERTHCRIPTRRQRRVLAKVLPLDGRGRPAIPGDSQFFDTLVAFQVGAQACGYRTNRVRALEHRTQAMPGVSSDSRRVWQQDLSNEVVHVGGISYHRRWFHARDLRTLYVAADQTILEQALSDLPAGYAERAARGRAELGHVGLDAKQGAELLRTHLVVDRGLEPAAAERILVAPAAAPH